MFIFVFKNYVQNAALQDQLVVSWQVTVATRVLQQF